MKPSVYSRGYEGWEVFDNLPKEMRDAHNVVWTGYPYYTSQHKQRVIMNTLTMEEARAIVELDGGRHMLAASDIDPRGDICYGD